MTLGEKGDSRIPARARARIRRVRDRLARLLAAQGIEVSSADEPFRSGARAAAGTYIVPLGAAVRAAGPQPARSDIKRRGVHQGAGPPPQDAARRSDLRRHRVEPAADLRRRHRRKRSRIDGQGPAMSHPDEGCRRRRSRHRRVRLASSCRGVQARPPRRRGAPAGDPHHHRRRTVHTRRPQVSDRHGFHSLRRQPPKERGERPEDRAEPRRRDSAGDRGRGRRRDLARQRPTCGRRKQPRVLIAWDAPVSIAVCRLGALRARAALRPEGHGRCGPRRSRTTT